MSGCMSLISRRPKFFFGEWFLTESGKLLWRPWRQSGKSGGLFIERRKGTSRGGPGDIYPMRCHLPCGSSEINLG
jgi:hypothetical protein